MPEQCIDGSFGALRGVLDYAGPVHIKGDICDVATVKCRGGLKVDGVIGAAIVSAGGDLTAIGGISGHGKGHCIAAGNLKTHYVHGAVVESAGDICIAKESTTSRIVCAGKLTVEAGTIIGGVVLAAGGVICSELGCAAGTTTLVEAGPDAALNELAARAQIIIDDYRKKVQRAIVASQRLLSNQKMLRRSDKERATQLLFQIRDLQRMIERIFETVRVRHDQAVAKSCTEISVSKIIHPGVIVRFPGVQAATESHIRGPVKITPAKVGTGVIVTTDSGRLITLRTRRVVDPTHDLLEDRARMKAGGAAVARAAS